MVVKLTVLFVFRKNPQMDTWGFANIICAWVCVCACTHFFFLFCNIYKGTKIFNCKFSLSMCWVLWHTQRWKIQCYSILLLFSSITVGDRYFTWVVNVYLCIYILTIIGRYYCISGTAALMLCCNVCICPAVLHVTVLCFAVLYVPCVALSWPRCALGSRLRSPAWLTGFLAVLFGSDHFQMCSSHIHRRDPPSIAFPPLMHALFFYPEVHFLFSGV